MSNKKLLALYLDNCNAIYYRTGEGLHAIGTIEDTYYYTTYADMISDIKYTLEQWKIENIELV